MDELEQTVAVKTLDALMSDSKALVDSVQSAVGSNPIASQVSEDKVTDYLAKIRRLFPGKEERDVDMALLVWAIRNGVGGLDDYAQKPPIVVGGLSVPAHKVFGEILPLGVAGIPRKVFRTAFEQYVPSVLESSVQLRNSLQPRLAKAGLRPGQELQLVDFVSGTTASTVGLASERNRAKSNLLRLKSATGRVPGGEAPMAVTEVQHPAPVFDQHAVSNLY